MTLVRGLFRAWEQEKFSSWTDSGTGVNPFLIPPKAKAGFLVRLLGGLLGACLIAVRLPVLALLYLLLVIVSALLVVVRTRCQAMGVCCVLAWPRSLAHHPPTRRCRVAGVPLGPAAPAAATAAGKSTVSITTVLPGLRAHQRVDAPQEQGPA